MQIGSQYLFDVNVARLRDIQGKAAMLQEQIGTGKRLLAPSVDPVAYGRVTALKRSMANEAQYADNVKLATSVLQQSDDALKGIEAQVQRAQELALRASNDTLSAENREAIAVELRNILDDIFTVANSDDVRGQPLFGGAGPEPAFTRDANGVVSYTGQGDAPPMPISQTGSIVTNDSGARLFTGIQAGSESRDIFSIVGDLAAALGPNGPTDPTALRAEIDRGITGLNAANDRLGSARASVGARGARLDLEAERLESRSIDQDLERAGLEDADLTESIANLQQTLVTLQATQASLAKLSQLSLFDYIS